MNLSQPFRFLTSAALAACLALVAAGPARAEIALSQVIVDFQSASQTSQDIEVWNAGDERAYVVAEPAEIVAPGLPDQRRVSNPDPEALGLLVTPQRLVLEPDQRRIIRISAIAPRDDHERIYRVTVRPVAGQASAESSALKILVGYDMLVMVRPLAVTGAIHAERAGRQLTIRNDSNTAYELYDGTQCDTSGNNCASLEATRLYPGAVLSQTLQYDTPVEYQASDGVNPRKMTF